MNYPNDTVRAITELLFIGKEPDRLLPGSDFVLVLGNDYIAGTVDVLANLYSVGIIADGANVIFSGATGSLNAGQEKECILLERYYREHYNLPLSIHKEDQATNLIENFVFSLSLINKKLGGIEKCKRMLVIGKAFALRRAEMCAMKLQYPVGRMQYYGTVDREGLNIGPDCWWKTEKARNRVMAEVERIGKYYLDGSLMIGV